MVEYSLKLNLVFGSLADPTRRDMLSRLIEGDHTISQLAAPYEISFAAVAKHLKVLEKAGLVMKRRRGNEQVVQLSPPALAMVDEYLDQYRQLMEEKLDDLEMFLDQEQRTSKSKGGSHG